MAQLGQKRLDGKDYFSKTVCEEFIALMIKKVAVSLQKDYRNANILPSFLIRHR